MTTLITLLVLALLAAITTIIFALGNPGVVSVHFLKWGFDSSLTLLMLAPFMIGLLLGWLISVPTLIKKTLRIAASQKKANKYEAKLQQTDASTTDTDLVFLP